MIIIINARRKFFLFKLYTFSGEKTMRKRIKCFVNFFSLFLLIPLLYFYKLLLLCIFSLPSQIYRFFLFIFIFINSSSSYLLFLSVLSVPSSLYF